MNQTMAGDISPHIKEERRMEVYSQKSKKMFGRIAEEYVINHLSQHGNTKDFRTSPQPFDIKFNDKIIEIKSSQLLHHRKEWGERKGGKSQQGYFYVNRDQHNQIKKSSKAYYIFVLMIGKEIISLRVVPANKINHILPEKEPKRKGYKKTFYPYARIPFSILYNSQKLNGGI